jgi:hypothetical protein
MNRWMAIHKSKANGAQPINSIGFLSGRMSKSPALQAATSDKKTSILSGHNQRLDCGRRFVMRLRRR